MTFLFMESRITHMALADIQLPLPTDSTRSGQGVTLLYLSFFEPETSFKCLNEILLLLSLTLCRFQGEFLQVFFFINIPFLWNTLPIDILNTTSYSAFKFKFKKKLFF